jgi:predicted TIM-barrel fold metal-dependent hydrolase
LRVFDCHIHVQPWEQFHPAARDLMSRNRSDGERVAEALARPESLLRLMDAEGIERAALINYVAPEVIGFAEPVNDWVSRFTERHRDRLVPVGSIHPRRTRDARGDARRLFEDLGIRMLKIHPPHQIVAANGHVFGDEALGAIYAAAEEAGRPVMIHTGTSIFPGARNRFADPIAADDVAVDFPKLSIILAHAGRPLYMETAAFLARRHPNLYLDLSGIPPMKLLEYLPRLEELSRKCLWGTDWPSPGVASMKKNVEDFVALPLSPEAKTRILWENAERLLGPGSGPAPRF